MSFNISTTGHRPQWPNGDNRPQERENVKEKGLFEKVTQFFLNLFSPAQFLESDTKIEMQDFAALNIAIPTSGPNTSDATADTSSSPRLKVRCPLHQSLPNQRVPNNPDQPESLRKLLSKAWTKGSSSDRDKMLATGADLKTAQGMRAEWHAAKIHALIVSYISRADTSVLESLGVPHTAKEQFISMISILLEFVHDADLSKPEFCEMANKIAVLMHKSFNADIGGVGCITDSSGWSQSWNHLGKDDPFMPGNSDNGPAKARFQEMMKFFLSQADVHFSPERHLGGRVAAAGQTLTTFGQIVDEFLFEEELAEEVREFLWEKIQNYGLFHKDLVIQGSLPEQLEKIKIKLRASPLVAEVPNSRIKKEIADALSEEENRNSMLNLIQKELAKSDPENTLSVDEMHNMANKILDEFCDNIKNVPTMFLNTGARGRLPIDPNAPRAPKKLGKTIAGENGVKLSIAVAPHRGNDQISINWVKSVFEKEKEVSRFFEAVEGDNILKHGPTPLVPLRLGTGLDNSLQSLLNPSDLMKKTILNALEENPDKATILKRLAARTATTQFTSNYQEILGNIPVTCNKTTKKKIPLSKFASMPSVVSIMKQHKIRTICSISGTTIGCILSIITSHGEEKAKELLQPLLDYLDGDSEALNSQAGIQFKKLTTELSFFMQTGQYHTAGEVLAALYIAGKALTIGDKEYADIDNAFADFTRLMEDFSKKPELFLAVEKEDLHKINAGIGDFHQRVIAAEKARYQNRLGQTSYWTKKIENPLTKNES